MLQKPGNSAWRAVSVRNGGSSPTTSPPSRAGSVNIPDGQSATIRSPLWIYVLCFYLPLVAIAAGLGYLIFGWASGRLDIQISWPSWRP